MPLPGFVREAVRALLALMLLHQYVVLFIVVAIEEAGVPLPAPTDVVIAFYGFRARHDLAELALVVFVCALASTAGTLVPYAITLRFGADVAHRVGRSIDIDPRQIDRWAARIKRHGFIAIFVGRLIPGARVVMSIVAGTAGVPLHQFSPAVFLGALVYWSLWVAIGAIFGPTAERLIGPVYIRYVFIGLPLLVIAFFVFRFISARRRHARLG